MTFTEVKKDYLSLVSECGPPYDLTDFLLDSHKIEHLVLNPSKNASAQYLIDMIHFVFRWGHFYRSQTKWDIYPHQHETVNYIYNKYIQSILNSTNI